MVVWECPSNPREASGLDPEVVHWKTLDILGWEYRVILETVDTLDTVVGSGVRKGDESVFSSATFERVVSLRHRAPTEGRDTAR
ncbi:hypothetical protein DV706_19875 (plasmid) [Natronorubrum bangense]|uniref:Uncharacterized protein n=2 Tax=Natronorubrum bangense TaxID=61858 RepID=L9W5W4_9EURY|nr:hypothetical protein C494_15818 [Natronorubrum bangense JCM 10635]QCC56800.1 hypothetical protein DV706_19875 [Natronorubrum bangense]